MKLIMTFTSGREAKFRYNLPDYAEVGIVNFLGKNGARISERWERYYERPQLKEDTCLKLTFIPDDNLDCNACIIILCGHPEDWEQDAERFLIKHNVMLQKKLLQIWEIVKGYGAELALEIGATYQMMNEPQLFGNTLQDEY